MHYVKQLFLLLALLLVATDPYLHAQNQFAPPGAEWCLRGYDGDGRTIGYVVGKYERDSLIRGVPTKVFSVRSKLLTSRGPLDNYYSPIELYQQSNDSVFYYLPLIEDQVFMFKESYELDEETVIGMYNEPFRILAVDDTVIDDYPVSIAKMNILDWLMVDLPATMYGPWGPDRGFFAQWGPFLDGLGGEELEAFRADTLPEVKIKARSQCFPIMEQEDNLVNTPVSREGCSIIPFPNPVSNTDELVRIRFDCHGYRTGNYTLLLYDTNGRVVATPKRLGYIPNDFSVAKLPHGKYIGRIVGEEEVYTFTFVKLR